MRLPPSALLMLGMVGLAGCAYVQKGDENQVEIGHSATMTSFAMVKSQADTHCGEFHKRAVLQAATSADTTLFRCEPGDAVDTAAKPAAAGGAAASAASPPRPAGALPAQGALPPGTPPPPPGYAYVYPQGGYPPGSYPTGAYPQAYIIPPGYMPVPPGYVPVPPQPAPPLQASSAPQLGQQSPTARPPHHKATPVAAQPRPVSPQPEQPAAVPAPAVPVAPEQPGQLQQGTALSVQ